MNTTEQTILSLIQNHNFDDFSAQELIEVLMYLDDTYNNDGELIINGQEASDKIYDLIHHYTQKLDPTNIYFTGVGSSVRGGKIKLPFPMPSLNQEQVGEITKWVKDNNLEEEVIVITDKMDGASLMAVYDQDCNFQIAYSRGDGMYGADVSRHYRKIQDKILLSGKTIRAEVIIAEMLFKDLKELVFKSDNTPYKNARNCVAGIMNSSEKPDNVYSFINVFAYQILNFDGSKMEELSLLLQAGFNVPPFIQVYGKQLNDEFLTKHLATRKKDQIYAIDGLVLDVNRKEKRDAMNKGITSGNPKSTVKYKVTDLTNQHVATVINVEYNVSKHGFLKPRVVFKPFELCGVTIQYATGFNAAFIRDNGIGPGAKVLVSRSGDVIPFVEQTIEQVTPQMPNCECYWNETNIDLIATDGGDEQQIQQLIDFCSSLELPHLKEGNVRTLFETGITTCEDIVNLSLVESVKLFGANGVKIHNGIQEQLTQVPLHVVMGSVPFFGRGVGKRKFNMLIQQIGPNYEEWTKSMIIKADGFDEKTATKIMEGIPQYINFVNKTQNVIVLKGQTKDTGPLTGHKVCMTGFRDSEMSDDIERLGGEVTSSVGNSTTYLVCIDPSSTSGKAQKARQINDSKKGNVTIIGVDEFKQHLISLQLAN